ncbi:DHBP synthase RibB-like alpha/beta domain-containing protein [Irpex rosettiformis]|uniref:DHBP synthase RibB-like alpha/beta domain-containing protein n=1 Tax=Irpex rosettiformis TaxID=378272 RepID=A0ACB8U4T5_9APHY|nr:DHBP synthase RibB-like alpha/beta domain-containing protein [Irpex rosettiformis]
MATIASRTRVLSCDPSSISFPTTDPDVADSKTLEALQDAASLLQDQEVVAFPTETVYGLGALALDPVAPGRIFTTKGRPADNPLIVHVSSEAMLYRLLPKSYKLPLSYQILLRHFWPGPLTLLFPTDGSIVPSIITANQPTVAVRMPSHPVARALIAITGAPIAAPSANSSGKPSPTRAEHVFRDLEGKLDLILDGGPCDVGLESTVVDGLGKDGNIRVLRPGGVTVEDIERVLAQDWQGTTAIPRVLVHRRDYQDEAMEHAPTTPGMKYRHYSPAVPVVLLQSASISSPPTGIELISVAKLVSFLKDRVTEHEGELRVGVLAPSDSPLWDKLPNIPGISWNRYALGPLSEPSITARRLFDGLLSLEASGAHIILIEAIAEEREGLAVMNRVKKAAGETVWLKA